MGPPGYNSTQGPPGVAGPPRPGFSAYNSTQRPPGVAGAMGPPGYNGTQDAPGSGSSSGGLSLCSYQEDKSATNAPSQNASTQVTATEPNVGQNNNADELV